MVCVCAESKEYKKAHAVSSVQQFFTSQALLDTFTLFYTFLSAGMVSIVDRVKRALVTLLNQLAALCNLVLGVTRGSTYTEVRGAFKTLSRRCRPVRRSGSDEHQRL